MRMISIACMVQRLCHRQIGVMQLHIFSHQANGNLLIPIANPLHQLLPLPQIRLRRIQVKLSAYCVRKVLLFQHQRSLIQIGQCSVFNNTVLADIAKQRNFLKNRFLQRFIAAQNNHIRIDPHSLQLLYRMLGRL